jgi:hypothetical protein
MIFLILYECETWCHSKRRTLAEGVGAMSVQEDTRAYEGVAIGDWKQLHDFGLAKYLGD